MSKIEVILPAMGEGIIEATITKWLVEEGKFVHEDESLLEIATDKVDSEIPAPASGMLSRIIYREGEIPKVGEVLAIIESGIEKKIVITEEKTDTDIGDNTIFKEVADNEILPDKPVISSSESKKIRSSSEDLILTPFIRFLAKNRGITFEELRQIKGTGLNGRITKADLTSYIVSGRSYQAVRSADFSREQVSKTVQKENKQEEYNIGPGEELIEMDRTRKLIAEHMVRSKRISPHVTSTVEVDVTSLVLWRNKNKDNFSKKYGVKLTFTPTVVYAAVKALKEFPDINISVSGHSIIRKKYINIGVATALPDGNLIVPVIKDADKRNFANIALQVADLASKARQSKLKPSDIKGGTFTITNMGRYDNISGTPIINQPEVAILAVGAIKRKPAVVINNGTETLGIRDIMVLSLTYDHRVVDGSLGGSFVQTLGKYLTKELPEY
ncbi:Dihydrolipoyllysine-residue acetyltransferase component of pyruvate dehydrogenase complex [subsurface metagenome]